ncbi:hypothetical protein AB0O76_22870 [Streptomyces sp. NPDC086554]
MRHSPGPTPPLLKEPVMTLGTVPPGLVLGDASRTSTREPRLR